MIETGIWERLGTGALVQDPPENCIYQSHLIRVRTNSEVLLPVYLERFLRTERSRQYFQNLVKRDAVNANINKRHVAALTVAIPPLKLQKEFAVFVEQVDKAKASVQKGVDEAYRLFDTLTQEFFG